MQGETKSLLILERARKEADERAQRALREASDAIELSSEINERIKLLNEGEKK